MHSYCNTFLLLQKYTVDILLDRWVQHSNDRGHVCWMQTLEMDGRVKQGSCRDGCWSLHTEWSDDTVINQSMTGKDTISAGEQHTSPDHLGHYAAHWPYIHWRWTFRWQGGGHANKNGEKKKHKTKNNKQSETNTKGMAVEWCVEMKTVEHAVAARYLRGSKHVGENVQPITVQKASNKPYDTGLFWHNSSWIGTK